MRPWSMSSISKGLLAALIIFPASPAVMAAEPEREPLVLSVVAVNPSAEKTQVVPVRIDLPQEVTPKDVIDTGELELEYDDRKESYYVYKEAVALAQKETRVFEVTVRDVWYVKQQDLDSLHKYKDLLMERLKESTYAQTAQDLGDSVAARLNDIATLQNDATLSRKTRIGSYRKHLQVIAEVKEDLARMEKLLTFTGGPPVPEMLEESPLKSDAPSTTTTWLVIFLVVLFIGLLGGVFFFSWNRHGQSVQELASIRETAFSGAKPGTPGGKAGK